MKKIVIFEGKKGNLWSTIPLMIFSLIFFLFPNTSVAQITLNSSFEGGNGIATFTNTATNTVHIKSESKGGDDIYSNFVYYTEILGLNPSLPLTLKVSAARRGSTIVYSYDNINWQRVSINPLDNFIIPLKSSSVFVAHTYPYTYTKMIDDVVAISDRSYVTVYDMAISEEGRPIKLVRITEDCTYTNNEKDLVWILGRIHAFEAPGNYAVAGMLDFFTSDHPAAKRIREEAIIYIVPMMDVDQVYNGGNGKNQSPVDFNRDWISKSHQSHWNAIKKAKIWIDSTAQLNPFSVFIDSHSTLPDQDYLKLFYYTYNVNHHISNSKFVRESIEYIGNYHVDEELFNLDPAYSQDYIIDVYDNPYHFNITLETGFTNRTDNVEWTKDLYVLTGKHHAQAVSDYIHGLANTKDILIDNNNSLQVDITGNWKHSTTSLGYFEDDYLYTDAVEASVVFNSTIDTTGTYEIFTRWVSDPNFASNVIVSFNYSGGTKDFILDMSLRGGNWISLDTFELVSGEEVSLTISSKNSNGIVIADGMRISKVPKFGSSPLKIIASQGNVNCYDACDGVLSIDDVTNGVLPFTYIWNTGDTMQIIENLCSNIYTVTVLDAKKCTVSKSYMITEPDKLVANVNFTDESANKANNGTATSNPMGGTLPYNYAWSTGSIMQSIIDLAPGQYIVTVTDANLCLAIDTFNIKAFNCPDLLLNSQIDNVSCFDVCDGFISILSVDNGITPFSYTWSTGAMSTSLSDLCDGEYQVTITDVKNCIVSETFIISQPNEIVITIDSIKDVGSDTKGAIFVLTNNSGNYIFEWSGLNNFTSDKEDIENLEKAGCYELVVTDTLTNCSRDTTICISDKTRIFNIDLHPLNINVYPNPTSDNFMIDFSKSYLLEAKISLYDMSGKEQMVINKLRKDKVITVELKNLTSGLYILKIQSIELGIIYEKIIINK